MEQRIFRLPDVIERTGLGKTQIYKMMKAGAFPRPVQLAPRAVGWRSEDLAAWIATRPEAAA